MSDVVPHIAELIAARLRDASADAHDQWQSSGAIRHCVIDALLPDALARALGERFPEPGQMRLRDTFRERKYVCAQMNRHDPELEAALFAFHAEPVLHLVRGFTGKPDLQADSLLYAGGISLMRRGHFLNPHVDNSHDLSRQRWRNVNLLYYVTPDSADDSDGALELWPDGLHAEPTVIAARFNRLIIMETHERAWHSVKPITTDRMRRCISNYYFGDTPMRADQHFHVTSFRARPGQPLRDLFCRTDNAARMLLRKGFRSGLGSAVHRYLR